MMLPTSHSTQNLQSKNALGIPLPPRSSSSTNLSSAAQGAGSTSSDSSTPSFLRSTTNPLGAVGGNGPIAGSHGSRDKPIPPPSPRTSSSPSLFNPAGSLPSSNPHANYDARLVANTINRIESTSGLGAVSQSIAGSGSTNGTATSAGSQESDAWTAVCIRTLPLL